MRPRSVALALLLGLGGLPCSGLAAAPTYLAPVNPAASEEAVNLYRFIQEIRGVHTLSGQHNFVGKGSAFTEQLETIIGKSPVIWGSDFSFTVKDDDAMKYQHAGPANLPAIPASEFEAIKAAFKTGQMPPPKPPVFLDVTIAQARAAMIAEAKARHARGQIITLMWHGPFPTDAYPCNGASVWAEGHLPTQEQWEQLVTDGTPLNEAWQRQVDDVAGYLKELRDAHIPVLWRPYHEMNGEWFWWGHKTGEQGFKRLWLMLYDRYTRVHGLNNLLWVWDANSPRVDETGERHIPYTDCYPGGATVDLLATDIYRGFEPSHYDGLRALARGKPIAIGECGALPSLEVLQQQNEFTWFMPWGWILFFANEPEKIKAIYNSERVLTLDEIAVDAHGRYTVKAPAAAAK